MVDDKYKIIFIHIPKTGGESIRSLFDGENYKIGKHATALQIKKHIDSNIWNSYFKFAFVRNPFNQAVSMYHHLRKPLYDRENTIKKYNKEIINPQNACRTAMTCDFATYVQKVYQERQPQDEETRKHWPVVHFQPLHKWITDEQGQLMVDYLARFESIYDDAYNIFNKIGMGDIELPHKNRSSHKPYQDYYDDKTRAIVTEFFKEDLERFDYSF